MKKRNSARNIFINCGILLFVIAIFALMFLRPVIEDLTGVKLVSLIPGVQIVRTDVAQAVPEETIPAPDPQKVGKMLTLLHEFNLSFKQEFKLKRHTTKWWKQEIVSAAIFQVMDDMYLTLNECEKALLVKTITISQMPKKVYLNGQDLKVEMPDGKFDVFDTFMVMSYRDTGYLSRYAAASESRLKKLKTITEQTFQDLIKKGLLTEKDKPTHTLLE